MEQLMKLRKTQFTSLGHLNVIDQKDNIQDLRILLSSDMKFLKHVDKVITAVNKKMGWILRTFRYREEFVMKVILKQLYFHM